MNTTARITALAGLAGILLTASSVQAVITVTSADDILKTGSSTFTISTGDISSFSPVGADKLILSLVYEQNVTTTAVTYNGNALTKIAENNNQWGNAHLWYIDKSSATGGAFAAGDLKLTVSTETHVAVSMMSVTGTADGFVAKEDLGLNSIEFTTGADNALVVSSFYHSDTTGGAASATAPSGANYLMQGQTGSGGGFSYTAAYWLNQPATETTYTWSDNSRPSMSIASFAAIPEPSAALLAGLGALMLLRRRRN